MHVGQAMSPEFFGLVYLHSGSFILYNKNIIHTLYNISCAGQRVDVSAREGSTRDP